jgi:hypothetical protein
MEQPRLLQMATAQRREWIEQAKAKEWLSSGCVCFNTTSLISNRDTNPTHTTITTMQGGYLLIHNSDGS